MAEIKVDIFGSNIFQWQLDQLEHRGITYNDRWFQFQYNLSGNNVYELHWEETLPEEQFCGFLQHIDEVTAHMDMHILPSFEQDTCYIEVAHDTDDYRGADND